MPASAPQILSVSEETLWQAILNRDTNFDGKLFYGVRSTNIYCRPTCPSRKPNRSQVTFFNSPEAAENQGFRPCKRCHPQNAIVNTLKKRSPFLINFTSDRHYLLN